MKKSRRFQALVDIQAHEEQVALEVMGRHQQKLQALQSQVDHLQSYRDDYNRKLGEQQRAGMNVNQLLEFRAFADKLDKAIEGQRQALFQQEREFQGARKHWEECRQRRKSLQKVSELAAAEELKIENKREQAEQDARAARSTRKDGSENA
jgi:flagellar protein FliJ